MYNEYKMYSWCMILSTNVKILSYKSIYTICIIKFKLLYTKITNSLQPDFSHTYIGLHGIAQHRKTYTDEVYILETL